MIVRILTEGQLRLPDTALEELNGLDDSLLGACQSMTRPRSRRR